MTAETSSASTVAIIGTGFGGLGMAWHLKQAGIDSLVIFEKADDVGGTWRENRYPGSGCDVPSHLYSFSFESHYPWAWRYARQPEILDYLRHCSRKFDLQRHIRFRTEVEGADFDAARGVWRIRLAGGGVHEARFLVSAVGQLHRPAYPRIPGGDQFAGKAFHSAHWDHDYDLKGKTVAVIGTGASAVQFVPEIAKEVQQLYLYQRTPGWTIPKVERPISPFMRGLLNRLPVIEKLDRLRIYGITELLAYAYMGHRWLERLVTGLAKFQLWRQVRDPALRRRLTPDFPVGCKRILLSNDWYPALTRPNVEVVSEAVQALEPKGVRSADGKLREVDAVIYGTGFAATEFLAPMQIRGLDGRELREQWRGGAEAYLGISVSGFPNLFLLYGPNTNVGSGSIVYMLECQQRYVSQLIAAQRASGWRYADLRADAQAEYVAEVQRRSAESTFEGSCQSWYKTAEGRNTNNWIGLMREYRRRTAKPDLARYQFAGP
ncbi:MAG: NAD(P)/FAD-dependent oxidoreductase [Nevskiaceae bacterium]|nr:MAG: NAD(P)/FAD-dependent oxidoreductase [Nevskiaceae bacterium]TAM25703.1 MAG: NAD(P)/FAD-dependent oxidoreductase [Nevskiaceae bacterium]